MSVYKLFLSFPIRKGTLDVESKAITRAIHSMGQQDILDVRMARATVMELQCRSDKAAKDISLKIVEDFERTPSGYNPLLHDLNVELKRGDKTIWTHQIQTKQKSFI